MAVAVIDDDRSMLLAADCVVSGWQVLRPGWVLVRDGLVAAVGRGVPPRPPDLDGGAVTIVPGFVDMHVHGGGGASLSDATDQAVATATGLHRRHGTTTMVASLVSADAATLRTQVATLAPRVHDGTLAGIHLEGPWLAPARRGAHDAGALRHPDIGEFRDLVARGDGAIRMVTLAPELPGAVELVAAAVSAGVVVAVGHTEASHDQTRAAVDAGASVATHLFNAMRPIHHRDPGPALALLEDSRVTLELIMDGTHVHPALYRMVRAGAAPDRIALVTDAMAAAGMSDGTYDLGTVPVDVRDGVARTTTDGAIAGSTATMDQAFRSAVRHGGQDPDEALLAAAQQSSVTPARTLGLPFAGLGVGAPANLVVLDDALRVSGVLQRGRWSLDPEAG